MSDFIGTGDIVAPETGGRRGNAGGMPVTVMLSLFGILLNDKDENEFYPELKLEILNGVQDNLILPINRHLFGDLEVVDADVPLSDEGTFDLRSLSEEVWLCPHGIDGIHVNRMWWCSLKDSQEVQQEQNYRVQYNAQHPVYYARGNVVHIEPFIAPSGDEAAFVDIYYKRPPRSMVLAQQDANNIDCELSRTMQRVIIGLACEEFVDRSKEARRAFDRAVRTIDELNSKVLKSETGLYGRNELRDHIINYGDDGAPFIVRVGQIPGQ